MAIVGDVVELVHEQTYLGQNVNNVYYYECLNDAPLSNLATWFETNVVPQVKANQVDLVNHVNLRTRNLFNDMETYEEPLTGVGSVVSGTAELPAFMAYTIRLDHDNGALRPGFKRYVGVSEASLDDGLVNGGRILALTTLAGYLINPPTVVTANWLHIVVGRVCEEVNPTPGAKPACLKYRLPLNVGEKQMGIIVTAEPYAQPTTQNSRKWYT
jgi:hypothetical protein